MIFSIHFLTEFPFYGWVIFLNVCWSHWSVDGLLGWFHILAIMNCATISMIQLWEFHFIWVNSQEQSGWWMRYICFQIFVESHTVCHDWLQSHQQCIQMHFPIPLQQNKLMGAIWFRVRWSFIVVFLFLLPNILNIFLTEH